MKLRAIACGILPGLCLLSCLSAYAENWPCWRGPRGDGSSLETRVPIKWSATENVAWKTPIPGVGHSSPVVWEGHLFLTTALDDSQERLLVGLDSNSGKILWQQTVLKAPLEAKNKENSYASATPATDGEKVYTTFLDGKEVVVAAYDFAGTQRWLARPGGFYSQWGFSHTPVLFEDKVIVVCDSKGENFIVALSQADGRVVWKVQRDQPTQSYSAPLLARMAGRMQMVVSGNKSVSSYDPRDGRKLWNLEGPSDDSVITPVYNNKAGLLLSCSSWPKRILVAIKPDGEGNVSRTKLVWSTPKGAPYVPSPISVGDYFFTAAFDKEAYCYEAASGRVLWQQPVGLHHASPVSANGLIYFVNDDGVVNVVKASKTFELVARNEMGEKTYASPAISEGRLFLRTFKNLYCIRSGA